MSLPLSEIVEIQEELVWQSDPSSIEVTQKARSLAFKTYFRRIWADKLERICPHVRRRCCYDVGIALHDMNFYLLTEHDRPEDTLASLSDSQLLRIQALDIPQCLVDVVSLWRETSRRLHGDPPRTPQSSAPARERLPSNPADSESRELVETVEVPPLAPTTTATATATNHDDGALRHLARDE